MNFFMQLLQILLTTSETASVLTYGSVYENPVSNKADIWQTNILLFGDHNPINVRMFFEKLGFIVSMHWTFEK